MSVWSDALRALQQAVLLQYRVDQALSTAEEARRMSLENRERLVELEVVLRYAQERAREQRRGLPSSKADG